MKAPVPLEAKQALEKAHDALKTAAHDLSGGFVLAATNRAYYACYYGMMAMLYTENTYAKTHRGTQAKFFELFIKPNRLPSSAAVIVTVLFDKRQEADYDLDADIGIEEVTVLMQKATAFLQMIENYFMEIGLPG